MNGEGGVQRAGGVQDLLYLTVRLVGLIGEGEEEQWPGISSPLGGADCMSMRSKEGFQKNTNILAKYFVLRTICMKCHENIHSCLLKHCG